MKEQMDWFESTALSTNFTTKEMDIEYKKLIVNRAKEEIEKFARYGLTI